MRTWSFNTPRVAAVILICMLTGFPSCLCAARGSNFFWWFEEEGRRGSQRSGDAGHGFLVCSFYLLCTAEHLFYRDGELSLEATLMLPQSQPGMCQGCVFQGTKRRLALGPGPEGRSCWGVEVPEPGCGVKL